MGTVEPVFGNVCGTLGLDKFSLRGKAKVEAHWQLFCAVHNIGKLAGYGRLAQEPAVTKTHKAGNRCR
jgi:hypothetical protein